MQIKCDHCQLKFDKQNLIFDDGHYFCCHGCKSVFGLLKNENLDSFYHKLGSNKLQSIKQPKHQLSDFDTQSFAQKFITTTNDVHEVMLFIEGIHCSACIWLNETILTRDPNILDININATSHKATIKYKNTKLSSIVAKINAIGYDVSPASHLNDTKTKTKNIYLISIILALFASSNIMMIDIAKYNDILISPSTKFIFNIAEWVLASIALFGGGYIFFKGAYYALKNKLLNMDFLIITGATSTYLYSIYIMFFTSLHTYFDSVCMIITFILISKYIELLALNNISTKLEKIYFMPKDITLTRDDQLLICKASDIEIGDIVHIKVGESIPTDGVILRSASLDLSMLTGESKTIHKAKNQTIKSGSVAKNIFDYKVTALHNQSFLQNIASKALSSLNKRSKIEQFSLSSTIYFIYFILFMSLFTLVLWSFIGSVEVAFRYAVSVVIISCPCAFAIAVPLAKSKGITTLLKNKILIKDSSLIGQIPKIKHIVFDKTKTLTTGNFAIKHHKIYKKYDKDLFLAFLAHSTHPIAKSILKKTPSGVLIKFLTPIKEIQSQGITTKYNNQTLLAGNHKLMQNHGIDTSKIPTNNSILIYAIDNTVVCHYELQDELKPNTKELFRSLAQKNIKTYIISGDTHHSTEQIAKALNCKEFYANLLACDKADFINQIKQPKIMIGDGINDTLAMSQADISISFIDATELGISSSDIILLSNDMQAVQNTIQISTKISQKISQNLSLSLIYNLIAIPLAVSGTITPIIAAISMSLSSLLVVANTIRK